MTVRDRPTAAAMLLLRVALAAGFLSAVADRFGLWGPAGTPGVAWGGFAPFLAYTGELLWVLPPAAVPAAGWAATVAEVVLAAGLVTGFRLRLVALLSAGLLGTFGVAMTVALGPEPPLSYSVWPAAAGALLLATLSPPCRPPPAPPGTRMKYTLLGRTGVTVSRLTLGCMSYGTAAWRPWVLDEQAAKPFFRQAVEAGINCFDTADMYSHGVSEEITGRLVREFAKPNECVIATKVFFPHSAGKNVGGLSRKHIQQACELSLKRLGVETIDLYQVHRFDPDTPIEETLTALDLLVKQGKVRYLGASSTAAWRFAQALGVSDRRGLARFATMQNHYNLVYREEERGNAPLVPGRGGGRDPVVAAGPRAAGRGDGHRAGRVGHDFGRPVRPAVGPGRGRRGAGRGRPPGGADGDGGAGVAAGQTRGHVADRRGDQAAPPGRRRGGDRVDPDGRRHGGARSPVPAAPGQGAHGLTGGGSRRVQFRHGGRASVKDA